MLAIMPTIGGKINLRSVDKQRLVKKMGSVSAKTLALLLATLQEVFAP
jgi:mRNA-degrading endonuclease toxin of MazEF toxin-antitoxin module